MIRQFWTNLVELDILTILCVLVGLGFIGVVYDLCSFIRRKRFGEKYLSKFKEFVDCGPYNPYKTRHRQWLLHNLTRMKNDMEGHGLLDTYSLASGDYPIQDADMVSDTLVNITLYSDKELAKTQAILEIYVGELATLISRKLWGLVNPFFWLRRMMRLIIFDAPFWILQSVGIISGNAENKIRYYSIISTVIAVLFVLATLYSLVKILIDIFRWIGSLF